jgi:tetratricopeptide (TPR) repeat protein
VKTIFGVSTRHLGTRHLIVLAIPAALTLVLPAAFGQTAALHGKVINAAGQIFNKGDVKLTTDKDPSHTDRKWDYTFPISSTGTYTGDKIVPGDYRVVVYADAKTVDYQDLTIKAGDDDTLNFDMTREDYIKAMKPEDRAALEEYKKRNAAVSAENNTIANLNAVLKQAREDEHSGKADAAVTALQGLTQQKADEPVIWASLGEAQLAVADTAYKTAHDAKQPTATPDIQAKYQASADSYQKAVDLEATSKKPAPELVANSELNIGIALAKAGKPTESSAAFDAAVKANPASAAMAYDNEAAILFNMGKLDDAVPVVDKAIAADPKKAINYYIKGQALIPKASVDPKTQKYILPPGCLEAYQEYLELAPDGQFANDVKQLLAGLGQPIVNGFKQKRR